MAEIKFSKWVKLFFIILFFVNLTLTIINTGHSFLPEAFSFDSALPLLIPIILYPRIESLQPAPVFKDTEYKTIDFIFMTLFVLTYILYSARLITFLF